MAATAFAAIAAQQVVFFGKHQKAGLLIGVVMLAIF